MAKERTRFGPARSSRFGPRRSSTLAPRQGNVFRLNQGSSTLGRESALRLNKPAGTFGSGRAAGGGTLAQALAEPSVVGSPVVGPPPVQPVEPPLTLELPPLSFPTRTALPLENVKPVVTPGTQQPLLPTSVLPPVAPTSTAGIFDYLQALTRGRYPGFIPY